MWGLRSARTLLRCWRSTTSLSPRTTTMMTEGSVGFLVIRLPRCVSTAAKCLWADECLGEVPSAVFSSRLCSTGFRVLAGTDKDGAAATCVCCTVFACTA